MKVITHIYNSFRLIVFTGMIFTFGIHGLQAQEDAEEVFEMEFRLRTIKNTDNSRSLIVNFYGVDEKEEIPVFEAKISFYNVSGDEEVLLGTSETSKQGIAMLTLPEHQIYLVDEEGMINFKAGFQGMVNFGSYEDEISIRDLKLVMELGETEETKSITVFAYTIDDLGEEVPVEETDIYFYVQGMINRLKIEDGWIEGGEYSFEFPDDLPGNTDGELTIYAMIEDSDEFGNVTQSTTTRWGTGPLAEPGKVRMLWTDLGPTWMIVLLTILLVGVWANIIHTVYNLIQINKESDEVMGTISNFK